MVIFQSLPLELLDTLDEVADDESLLLEACRQDSLYPIYFEHINTGRMQFALLFLFTLCAAQTVLTILLQEWILLMFLVIIDVSVWTFRDGPAPFRMPNQAAMFSVSSPSCCLGMDDFSQRTLIRALVSGHRLLCGEFFPRIFQNQRNFNNCAAKVLLACAPYIVHSSLTLLILFLCYTLLPLPLLPTALAAAVVSATGLSIQLIHNSDGTMLISHAILFLAINIVGFLVFYPLELVQRKTFRETRYEFSLMK
ncbi:hypothetical protein ANCCAN_13301 [Ancylostoma caninum]|uniref:Adenylate cyclase N-terminal domain-containing protein n=1 Tax=Ancylostoma caninum TaxID=29170 RepID=A0A368G8L3_ANCCA|nr:hypothetical protein ANCCAN_13301 [Ancylostoma caninum]